MMSFNKHAASKTVASTKTRSRTAVTPSFNTDVDALKLRGSSLSIRFEEAMLRVGDCLYDSVVASILDQFGTLRPDSHARAHGSTTAQLSRASGNEGAARFMNEGWACTTINIRKQLAGWLQDHRNDPHEDVLLSEYALSVCGATWPDPPCNFGDIVDRIGSTEWADDFVVNFLCPKAMRGLRITVISWKGQAYDRVAQSPCAIGTHCARVCPLRANWLLTRMSVPQSAL